MIPVNDKPIFVTQPALPPLEEFIKYLEKIWETKSLTNVGDFHIKFEHELADYLGVKYISVFSNGTIALLTALQTLQIKGEVITTPFSFVATAHSLLWNGIEPVFVDIENKFLNIDPSKIEAAVTTKTKAIMPVHVYGNPCKIEEIQDIANKYGLKVIYDAAHAFGVKIDGNSILNFGDLSVLSFHATKVFNTIEGGAIVCHDEKTKKRIDFLKNFGFADEVTVVEAGINGKMNELQAAYGLLQLKYVDTYIEKRRIIAEKYQFGLKDIAGIRTIKIEENVQQGYPYFPILIDEKVYKRSRDEVYEMLKANNIFGRRYFYPLISQFRNYRHLPSARPENLPVAENIAKNVICLPIFPLLELGVVDKICDLLNKKF
jgi:dTDP-4-amino-4,6-dideoxygalactose transaminase